MAAEFKVAKPVAGSMEPKSDVRSARKEGLFFQRREAWTLTAKGWLLLFLIVTAACLTVFYGVHPFLALTDPAPQDVMIVEGWIPDFALLKAAQEYQSGHYRLLMTIGGPFRSGVNLEVDDDYAHLSAYKLAKLMKTNAIVAVPSPGVAMDRTYSGAMAAKKWLEDHHQQVTAVNVVTLSVHARRSRLLFEKAFGDDVMVGSIAVPDRDYDSKHWWRYSEGLKEVVSEAASYLYARVFFHPSQKSP